MPRQYSDEAVKKDVKSFFLDSNHWAYKYGDPTPMCNPDSPYYRKQIEILFENKYQHWVTDRAVTALIQEGFLHEQTRLTPEFELSFIYRYNLRRIAMAIRERTEITRRYSDISVSRATGDQAEFWALYLFKSNSFSIVGRHAREYQGIVWTKTEHDLDFIIEKDGIAYGVEVKNKFPYLDDDLYDKKLDICIHLRLRPLFFFRIASYLQIEKAKKQDGKVIIFKSKIFPPGNEQLVREIWNKMRLPVSIWKDVPQPITQSLITYHDHVKSQ
jgi:hypothetical protein